MAVRVNPAARRRLLLSNYRTLTSRVQEERSSNNSPQEVVSKCVVVAGLFPLITLGRRDPVERRRTAKKGAVPDSLLGGKCK